LFISVEKHKNSIDNFSKKSPN